MTDEQADLVRRQQERWADPATQAGAEQRMARVRARMDTLEPKLQQQLQRAARAPHFRARLIWLRETAATVAGAVAPQAACRAGCDWCCHQPVMVTQAEAQVIARESDAKLAEPARWRREPAMEFSGQACPFLKDRRCSIYAHRPMACRTLYNLDVDNLQCRIVPGAAATVPYADLRQFDLFVLRIQDSAAQAAQMADLRDFFPKGLSR